MRRDLEVELTEFEIWCLCVDAIDRKITSSLKSIHWPEPLTGRKGGAELMQQFKTSILPRQSPRHFNLNLIKGESTGESMVENLRAFKQAMGDLLRLEVTMTSIDALHLDGEEKISRFSVAIDCPLTTTQPSAILMVALRVLVRPLEARFRFHFLLQNKQPTNRLDKPEWFFLHVIKCIRDHLPFMTLVMTPLFFHHKLVDNAEGNTDALFTFIELLLEVVDEKVGGDLELLEGRMTSILERVNRLPFKQLSKVDQEHLMTLETIYAHLTTETLHFSTLLATDFYFKRRNVFHRLFVQNDARFTCWMRVEESSGLLWYC